MLSLVGPPGPEQTRCAVLGFPIEHSLSPVLHAAAYAELGLTDWSYDRYLVDRGELAEFVGSCGPNWRGFSMTMPLKDEALDVGEVSPEARLTGAANTLIFDRDRIVVHNTDIEGFWRPLVAHFQVGTPAEVPIESAVILGGGATARSAFYALTLMGVEQIVVAARTKAKVDAWAPMFDATGVTPEVVDFDEFPAADLLISTVTKGAADGVAERAAQSQEIVFDAIYDGWPTVLARAAAAADRVVFSGLDMLVGQALAQVELMTGRTVAPDPMMAAGLAAIAERADTV
ncbi:MAG: shikimate dehydrogenase [Propionibacteriaceae bacterium]|nr:shikimate dehydrogenase [Propionibacteriaceae bacterium]